MATCRITITMDTNIPLTSEEREQIEEYLKDTFESEHIHIHEEEIED